MSLEQVSWIVTEKSDENAEEKARGLEVQGLLHQCIISVSTLVKRESAERYYTAFWTPLSAAPFIGPATNPREPNLIAL